MVPTPMAVSLAIALVLAADPAFELRLHAPADAYEDEHADPRVPLPEQLAPPERLPYGPDAIPLPSGSYDPPKHHRKLGTPTTIFVNFDGVTISACSPSNSHENCHWFEDGRTFEPYSGSLAHRVAILDAMRSQVRDFGIRVTGQRPPDDEVYLMLVYGGDSETGDEDEEVAAETLGRAPAGDCYDDLPNQIGYVYLDGDRASWVNGGASTALHEAGHTWGFDHIGLDGSLMAPTGGNILVDWFDGCAQIVENLDFDPSEEGSCPEISLEQCGLPDFQHDVAMLELLFGPPYVDTRAPTLELVKPFDGIYYQGPASFDVDLRVIDDLHPQVYELAIGIAGLIDDPAFKAVYDPSFEVVDLPIGEWEFQLQLRDAAGNETSLAFVVNVGEDAPGIDDGCQCTSASGSGREGPIGLGLGLLALIGVRARRHRSE